MSTYRFVPYPQQSFIDGLSRQGLLEGTIKDAESGMCYGLAITFIATAVQHSRIGNPTTKRIISAFTNQIHLSISNIISTFFSQDDANHRNLNKYGDSYIFNDPFLKGNYYTLSDEEQQALKEREFNLEAMFFQEHQSRLLRNRGMAGQDFPFVTRDNGSLANSFFEICYEFVRRTSLSTQDAQRTDEGDVVHAGVYMLRNRFMGGRHTMSFFSIIPRDRSDGRKIIFYDPEVGFFVIKIPTYLSSETEKLIRGLCHRIITQMLQSVPKYTAFDNEICAHYLSIYATRPHGEVSFKGASLPVPSQRRRGSAA